MPVNVGNTYKVKEVLIDISTSTTVSEAVDLGGLKVFSIYLPAAFTGVAMTFQACDTIDGTYQVLMDDAGSAISITVAQGQVIGLTSTAASLAVAGCRFIKMVSGSAELADRVIKIIGRA